MPIQNTPSYTFSLNTTTTPLHVNELVDACVLFIDMQDFTQFTCNKSDKAIVQALHYCYCLFDNIITKFSARPIKYNGDACIILLETGNNCFPSNIENSLYLYNTLNKAFSELCELYNVQSALRAGLAFGPVLSGQIGSYISSFDIWGHTVNLAARLEQNAPPNSLLMNKACHDRMLNPCLCEGITLELKGFVPQQVYQYHKREP